MSDVGTDAARAQRVVERHFREFEAPVVRIVTGRLRRRQTWLSTPDIEAAYSRAWHGVYEAIAQGQRVENLMGMLVTITYMRSIDLYRQRHQDLQSDAPLQEQIVDLELAERLDDRQTINGLLVRLSERLNEKERAAVALCVLRGYPRAETAVRLGLTDRALKKVMDSANKKLAGIVQTLQSRGCADDEWARALRGYALGITPLDSPEHQRVADHIENCQPCRRYVCGLRGLSAIFPPVLPFLHDRGVLPALHKLLASIRPRNGIGRLANRASGGSGVSAAPSAASGPVASLGGSSGAGGVASAVGGGGGSAKVLAVLGVVLTGAGATIATVHTLNGPRFEPSVHRAPSHAIPPDGAAGVLLLPGTVRFAVLSTKSRTGAGHLSVSPTSKLSPTRRVARRRARHDRAGVSAANTTVATNGSEFGFEQPSASTGSVATHPAPAQARTSSSSSSSGEEFAPEAGG